MKKQTSQHITHHYTLDCLNHFMMPFLLLLLVGVVYASSDLYQTLGVSRGANEGEIKKAFKEKSLQFHPDRNQDPSSSRKYQDIIQAYEVLKDNNKRHLYDQTGSTDGTPQQPYRHSYQHQQHFSGFEEIFRQFEEQMHSQRSQYQHQHQQQRFQQGINQQEYEVRQYIDQFGRIRTVVYRRGEQATTDGGVAKVLINGLLVPLQMILVFGVAYLAVSLCSVKDNKKQ